jgi:ATP adenylyltransferase
MPLEHLWAGWRGEYIATATPEMQDGAACVFCRILASGRPDDETFVVWRSERVVVLLNAYPYTSGHVMVLPVRNVADVEALEPDESAELWATAVQAVATVKAAYSPGGVNMGANLGPAAGAGVPGHLHLHVLPRWAGDTNFMTSVADLRVLPEALSTSWRKLRDAWPGA